MNTLYVLSLAVLALAAHVQGGVYNEQHDGFDMKAAVADIDTLKQMVGCFLDTNPCNDITSVFKKDIPDAVVTSCAKCKDAQKDLMHIFLDALKTKLPAEYEAFKNKYDPAGKSFGPLEANIAEF